MRILQIIDSLEAGGAERMAVNYANALSYEIDFSGLIVTRKEGPLLNQLNKNVSYLYLDKKSTIDFGALFRLRKYIVKNKVTIVHAHSTSFFLAFILKLVSPSIRVLWHDHYGDSEFLTNRPLTVLRFTVPFFKGIIAVNHKLKDWAQEKLNFNNVIYLPNFPSNENKVSNSTILSGAADKRIVSLANLREQKNHFLLLEVAKKMKVSHQEWTFHLIGKDFLDEYSQQIKNKIVELNLEENVFIYDAKQDIKNILDQSTIAILTSQSEGLPVALLEYGWYKKSVVVTAVGEIPSVILNGVNGFIVASNEKQLFYESVVILIENNTLRAYFGGSLHQTILKNYSQESILKHYLNWLKTI